MEKIRALDISVIKILITIFLSFINKTSTFIQTFQFEESNLKKEETKWLPMKSNSVKSIVKLTFVFYLPLRLYTTVIFYSYVL